MRKNLVYLACILAFATLTFVLGVFHGQHYVAVADAHHAEIPILHFKQLSMDNTEHERWHAYAVAALKLPKWREGTPIAEWSNPKASADWAIKNSGGLTALAGRGIGVACATGWQRTRRCLSLSTDKSTYRNILQLDFPVSASPPL